MICYACRQPIAIEAERYVLLDIEFIECPTCGHHCMTELCDVEELEIEHVEN